MDPALLKQRQDFMKSAIKSMSINLKKNNVVSTSGNITSQKKKKISKKLDETDYKTVESISNAANFSVMAKIVDYMKKRHLNQQPWPLSLRDILEEMQLQDLQKKTELWLKEALPSNPRLQVQEDGKLLYSPPYKIKNKTALINFLKKNYLEAKGGVLLSVLNDCIPNAEQQIKSLESIVVDIPSQFNKRKDHAYFYNDLEYDYKIDDSFIQLWRMASVEHLDERKIEEYLQKHGISNITDAETKRLNVLPKRKQARRKINQKVHNLHLEDVLEDYE